jgi:hypothetical protein
MAGDKAEADWKKAESGFGEELTPQKLEPIFSRFFTRIRPGSQLHEIFSHQGTGLDFDEILNKGRVLLVRVPRGADREAADFVCGAFVTAIQNVALARERIPEKQRRPFYLYADECHNYTVPSFQAAYQEGRKYQIGFTAITTSYTGLPDDLRRAFGSAYAFIAFCVDVSDASEVMKRVRATGRDGSLIDPANLDDGEAVVRLDQPSRAWAIETERLLEPPPGGEEVARQIRAQSERYYATDTSASAPPTSSAGETPPEGRAARFVGKKTPRE